ncbi:Putative ATP-dependent RNA helicase DEAD-box, Helicase superfamily 1/2, ATP-binding protein [Colletotrichum destructivum]|uniref:RNA helicase n=1 Tax=Colletotrichum destructivum TaxID=34406 RepID=A0AAX4IJE2_9PEZI|nr:Putative ATP-dependent RNA helicase DEAD-box, Helicase superfamily 1/2, ATP-binding protein [Colletotrichum destructivum]
MEIFDTANMQAALSSESSEKKAPAVVIDNEGKAWAKPLPYNYDELAKQGPVETTDWEGNGAIYEWNDEFGDVGPKFPELELALFGNPDTRHDHSGLDFSVQVISSVDVSQDGPTRIEPVHSYKDAGLHPVMLENVELAGYEAPTPIQKYTLPAIHQGLDVVAVAQTGSGKTAAYLIPILNKLMGKAKKLAASRPNPSEVALGQVFVRAEPLVVIVCPTRELAIQIFNEARKFCYRTMLRPCVAYGGGPIRDQIQQLGKGCDVLIASPGRLCDFIQRPDVLSLRRLRYMVFDEADEMLHDSWREEFDVIMTGGEQQEGSIKYMLFSATFPKPLRDLAKEHLSSSSVRINIGRIGSTHANIMQRILEVAPFDKKTALKDQINSLPACRTIIFVNSKRTADDLDDFLYNMGFPCTSMHSDRTQLEREASMRAFRAGKTPILIATGISARGIDVKNVNHVINYDLPSMDHGGIEEYTHRIGRTGRMGQRGIATSFYTERDEPIASVLVRTLLETKQEVPGFLEPFKPTGKGLENLKFETESDFDPEEAGVAHLGISSGDGGWSNEGYGGDDDAASAAATGEDAAWGGGGGGGDASAGGNSAWGGASDNTGNEIKKEETQAASVWESSAGGSAW